MRKLRALMVEDSADDAELAARTLRAGGYELTYQRVDTRETLQAELEQPGLDLALVDISLPHLDGLEALLMLRGKDPDLPVVVVSGTVGEDFAVRAMKAGANDMVLKNALTRLCPTVERELSEAEVRRARRRAEAELRMRLAQQEAVAKLSRRGLSANQLGPLLGETATAVSDTLGVEYCQVLDLDANGKTFLLRAGVGWKEGLVGRATISAGLDSQAGYTLSMGEPVIVEDFSSETRFPASPLLRDHGVVSGISTVIGNPKAPWGVLGAHTRSRRKFTHDDINFVQAMANIIAATVEHLASVEELRQAQSYTRGLIEASVDAILTIGGNLEITDANEQMAKLAEVPKPMLIGSPFGTCFTEPQRAAEAVSKTLSQGSVTNYDLTLRAASGTEVLVSFNASIIHDAAGKALGVLAVARDVTEQRRVERELREQRNYSRGLIEASIDALFAVDPELRITDVNEETGQFTGYSRAELTGIAFPTLFTEPERAAAVVRTALAKGSVKDCELTVRSVDGLELPISLNSSAIKDAAGNVLGIVATARDISERLRIGRERALLAAIVESASDAIYSLTSGTIVTSWNRGAEKLYGFTAREMIGRSATVIVPLSYRAEMLDYIGKAIGGEVRQFDTLRRRKDGSLVDVSLTISPILDSAGQVTGVAMIGQNISERKRLDQELTSARDDALEAARVRSEFLANMSHEIRTPLNSIMGMTQILLDNGLNEHQVECARAMRESSEGLLSIINDILDFSRIAAGKLSLEAVDLDLESTIGAALDLVAEQAHGKGLEVAVAIGPDVPRMLRGDSGRLRQVLLNLLSNAVKFTEHGEIVVRVDKLAESPGEATLRFEVRDTGIGIPKEAQERLFQPFNQVDQSDSREHGGTGLGLAISRELVESMGGTISVKSDPGAGSTFWFTAKLRKQGDPAQILPSVDLSGTQVLVVDDNQTNRDILSHQLAAWSVVSDAAAGAEEALQMLREHARHGAPFKVALLDLRMPVMDGLELARRIRGEPAIAGTVLIMLSSTDGLDNQRGRREGLDIRRWLLKPVKPSELYNALVEAVGEEASPPRVASAASHTPSLTAAIDALGARERKLRALVVEDNATNRRVALWHLVKLGFTPTAVPGGSAALEELAHTPYDVVLMDCRMPKLDGYETTRTIRQREGAGPHTKIVAMTAHALPGDREKCLAAGMDDYVSKPISMDSLVAVLARVLGRRGVPQAQVSAAVSPASGAAVGGYVGSSVPPLPAPPLAENVESEPEGDKSQPLGAAMMDQLRATGDLLGNLIRIFLEEMPEQLAQLARALGDHDGENAAIIAHGLKGSAATFGAARMRELAEQVEKAADRGAFDEARAGLEVLRAEGERVRGALEAEPARQARKPETLAETVVCTPKTPPK